MIKLRSILFENPDFVYDADKKVAIVYGVSPNYAFGYIQNEMFIGGNKVYHHSLLSNTELKRLHIKVDDLDRRYYKFPGRMWPEEKIISFWEFPTEDELNKIIIDLNTKLKSKKSNIKIDNNWKINILSSGNREKLVSIGDYIHEKMSPYTVLGIKKWPGYENAW